MKSIIDIIEKVVNSLSNLPHFLFFVCILAVVVPDVVTETVLFITNFFPNFLTNYLKNINLNLTGFISTWMFIVILLVLAVIYDILTQTYLIDLKKEFESLIRFVYNLNSIFSLCMIIYSLCFGSVSESLNPLTSVTNDRLTIAIVLFLIGISLQLIYLLLFYCAPLIIPIYSAIYYSRLPVLIKAILFILWTLVISKIFEYIGDRML